MPLYLEYPSWLAPEIIPGVPVFRWYGLLFIFGFFVTFLLFQFQIKNKQLEFEKDQILNFFIVGTLGMLIGARLFSVLFYDPVGKYLKAPWRIILPFDENWNFTGFVGLSFHGGLFGTLIALWLFSRRHKLNVLELSDLLALSFPVAYVIGRIGNFINQELYGRVSDSSLAVLFPNSEPLPLSEPWVQEMALRLKLEATGQNAIQLPRHPSQLYEALGGGIILGLLLWFASFRKNPFHGFLLGIYLVGYGLFRFILEYFRQPDLALGFVIEWGPKDQSIHQLISPWNFTMGQILSFFMMIFGLGFIAYLYIKKKSQPSVETFESLKSKKKQSTS
jgi:phosphatidylglycerol:prolipoprotein diacylglycerol transferase